MNSLIFSHYYYSKNKQQCKFSASLTLPMMPHDRPCLIMIISITSITYPFIRLLPPETDNTVSSLVLSKTCKLVSMNKYYMQSFRC